jgi:hypothetical protein
MDPKRRTRAALLLVAPSLVVAVAAGIVTVSSRGDAAFVYEQKHPASVGSQELEVLIAKAREPTPEGPGAPAQRVRCRPGGNSPQRNPWRCSVLYGSGNTIRYTVTVKPNGAYVGADPTGQFLVRGCCVSGGRPAEG